VSPAAKTTALAASLAFAESFAPQPAGSLDARERSLDFDITPVSAGVTTTLTLLARIIKAAAVIEVGTGTGVSALALLAGMTADGILTSIDPENELQLVAREVLVAEGIPNRRARLIAGQPLVVLPKLTDHAYDLMFVDGDPIEYVEYVDQAMRLLRSGGILVLHHALWHDEVADETNDSDEPLIIREALDAVTNCDSFTSALWPIGDGLLVAVINPEQ